jgi:hypothetical protein
LTRCYGDNRTPSLMFLWPSGYFPLSLGSLNGTCREALDTIELRSVRLMIVSRTRKYFSASMAVALVCWVVPTSWRDGG